MITYMKRAFQLGLIGAATLLLAACSSGTPPSGDSGTPDPGLTVEDTNAAIGEIQASATQTATSLQQTEAFAALTAVSGGAPTLSTSFAPMAHPDGLPHGHYTWNGSTWEETDPNASNLIYDWEYQHETATRTATATVDWDGSTELADGSVAPTGATATLTGDGTDLAEVSGSVTYQDTTCGLIAEPESASIDGFVGVTGDRVDFDADLAITDGASSDTVTTSGAVDAVSGANKAGFDWDVSLSGEIERGTDCFYNSLALSSADIDFGGYADDNTFAFALDVTELVWDDAGTVLESVALDGSLRIDGAVAIAFSGTFDDADGDGVPGENLVLTFADEEMTLEAYLNNEFMYSGAAAAIGLGILNAVR